MKPEDDDDDDNEKRDEEEKSSKARDHDRERFVATPTDFAIDYGRGLQKTGSFDASNGKQVAFRIDVVPRCE
jgi:hypothetical protein